MDPQISAHLLALLGLLALLTVTPGPDMALVARNGARGARAALATAAGVCGGLVVQAALVTLGAAALVRDDRIARVVAAAGGCYLLWLGVQGLREGLATTEKERAPGAPLAPEGGNRDLAGAKGAPGASLLSVARQGLVSNVLNPKVALFYLAALAPLAATEWWLPLAMGGAHVAMTALWLAAYGIALARISQRAGVVAWVARVAGVALLAMGAWVLVGATAPFP